MFVHLDSQNAITWSCNSNQRVLLFKSLSSQSKCFIRTQAAGPATSVTISCATFTPPSYNSRLCRSNTLTGGKRKFVSHTVRSGIELCYCFIRATTLKPLDTDRGPQKPQRNHATQPFRRLPQKSQNTLSMAMVMT